MHFPRNRSGFTLIDTLMAASLMAIVLIGVFWLLKSGVADTRSLGQSRRIDQIALSVRSCILAQIDHTNGVIYGITYSRTDWCTRTTGAIPTIKIARMGSDSTRIEEYFASYTVAPGTLPTEQVLTQTVSGPNGNRMQSYSVYTK